jgi:hypothetical protein
MALQLAWYRDQGSFTATYETALTRLFRNGRTETIRTFSSDGRAFVLAMMDPSAAVSFSALRCGSLLTNGCRSRTKSRCFDVQSQRMRSSRGTLLPERVLTDTCSGSCACQLPVTLRSSRTLFSAGLKSGSSAQVLLVPVIFSEAPGMFICFLYLLFFPDCCLPGLAHPILMDMGSTVSALALVCFNSNCAIDMTGPDLIKFGVESKYSCPSTSTSRFLQEITCAMRDMKYLFADSFPTARL